jgi:nitrogen fixation protein FixH
MSAPTDNAPPVPRRAYLWPVLVIVLLAGHVLLLSGVVLLATRDRAFAIEPDYYQKALHWDDTGAQQQTNTRLGWHAELSLGDTVGALGERALICKLTAPDDQPLDGAHVTVLAFPHAQATLATECELPALGGGRYATAVRFQRKGVWEFRLRATRGADTFTYAEQRDVYPPGEHRP